MFERDELDLSDIIEESLEEIQSGRSSLEDVLKQHPDVASTIRPELEIALWLAASEAEVAPRPGFVRTSRKRLVERVREESAGMNKKRGIFGLAFPSFNWQPVAALVTAAFLLFALSGLVRASDNTVPGETLYTVKRISENVQFSVALNDTSRVELATQFSRHRLQEIAMLLDRGKPAEAAELFDDFQMEVTRTVSILNQVNDNPPEEMREAAEVVQSEMAKQVKHLDEIMAVAPTEVREGLGQARTLAMQGAMIAVDVEEAARRRTATPSPSGTPTKSASSTPLPTNTVVPSDTPEPPAGTAPEATGNPAENTEPTQIPPTEVAPTEVVPTKEPKVTNTPRPTNENRPTEKPPKEEPPPKEENPPGKGESKPPKDD